VALIGGRIGMRDCMAGRGYSGETNNQQSSDFRRHGVIWTTVLTGHLVFAWYLISAPIPMQQGHSPTGALTVFTLTATSKHAVGLNVSVPMLPVELTVSNLPALGAIEGPNSGAAARRSGGSTVPPHPDDAVVVDAETFARRAGLDIGSGATVVLRVEVYGTGAVGRVEVDVSGGTRRIDQAAIAYVRSLKWIGGRMDEGPATLWVRWGVRFQGIPGEAAMLMQSSSRVRSITRGILAYANPDLSRRAPDCREGYRPGRCLL
jgi:hypothetical protein